MIDEETISRAVRLLLDAAPGSRVILFGSYARGQGGPESDLDFLVVEPKVESRRSEMVRLRDVLRPLRIPVDVLVVSKEVFQEWRDTPNTVFYEAAREGRVFDEVA
jgi:predicted nucleotidyltransferase